jgi:long-chain acyl-CoA synthetase
MGESFFTFKELNIYSAIFSEHLKSCGVQKGARVALYLPNTPEFIVSYFAIQRLGAVAVSIGSMLKHDEVRHILDDSSSKVLVTDDALLKNIPDHLKSLETIISRGSNFVSFTPEHIRLCGHLCTYNQAMLTELVAKSKVMDMENEDPAAILYTSGTTGKSKGAVLSHGNVISNVLETQRAVNSTWDDVQLCFLPLYHCFGQNFIMLQSIAAGSTLVLQDKFSPNNALQAVADENVTMFYGVPPVFNALRNLSETENVFKKSVRYNFSAAAKMPLEIAEEWRRKINGVNGIELPIYEGYGLTETSPFASYNHWTRFKPGSIGRPINFAEMKIIDPASKTDGMAGLKQGEEGEICIRGPNVMKGYYNRPDETSEAISPDGWFRSGDIGFMDEEGYFFITDRKKDMVNRGGFNVYPNEVEDVIYGLEGVGEVAVYGKMDDKLGREMVYAQVKLKGNANLTAEDIISHCREKIASYKVPEVVNFGDIPKSPTGKILKRILRGE